MGELNDEKLNRPGTPLLDEPVQSEQSSTKSKPTNLKIPTIGGGQTNNEISSPGSTPEAHTPLMDEPNEFNFDTAAVVNPHVDSLSGDYLRFPNQPHYSMPPSSVATRYLTTSAALGAIQQQTAMQQQRVEAFESITPPSSPEHSSTSSQQNYYANAPTSTQQTTNPIAAFPFSALAINVGSRPNSRSGSICQSPGTTVSDHSPRSDFEHSISGKSSKLPSKRKRDDSFDKDSFDSLKRSQKRSYRRSGSQSSSSSISKSPDGADYGKNKRL